jgi:hypothetical protein
MSFFIHRKTDEKPICFSHISKVDSGLLRIQISITYFQQTTSKDHGGIGPIRLHPFEDWKIL